MSTVDENLPGHSFQLQRELALGVVKVFFYGTLPDRIHITPRITS